MKDTHIECLLCLTMNAALYNFMSERNDSLHFFAIAGEAYFILLGPNIDCIARGGQHVYCLPCFCSNALKEAVCRCFVRLFTLG